MVDHASATTKRYESFDCEKYLSIYAKATKFYKSNLFTNCSRGMARLRQLRISTDSISSFMLGYAPSSGHALIDYLKSEGVSEAYMMSSGLIEKKNDGLIDLFCDRVMFPIVNTQDKVIAFRGMSIDDVSPKIITLWKAELPMRKDMLFGLNLTKKEIETEEHVIIVEGCMDQILLYQNGIKNVAATLGQSMTISQANLLCSYSKNIVLLYDSDSAGANAALRDSETIVAAGGNPYIMSLGNSKDPAEFIKTHDKGVFAGLVDDAMKTVISFSLKNQI